MIAGSHHTEAAKRRISESRKVPLEVRVEADRQTLKLVGPATKFVWADRMGCDSVTANKRLRRLWRWGYAERFKSPGMAAYTYVANEERTTR